MLVRQKSSSHKTAKTNNDQWANGWDDYLKYRGTYVGSSLACEENIDHILEIVFKRLVQSSLSFNTIMWFGQLNTERRSKLQKTVNVASKIKGKPQKQLRNMFNELLRGKADQFINDPSLPL